MSASVAYGEPVLRAQTPWRDAVRDAAEPVRRGRVVRVVGLHVEVAGIDAAIGDLVHVRAESGDVACEVIALHDTSLVCMPFGELRGVRVGAPVGTTGAPHRIGVGMGLLGRVIDGLGRPIDGRPLPAGLEPCVVAGSAPNPLQRTPVREQLSLGVSALDTLVPCGRGQRMGIFAGSGVGKSSLLSMMIRGTDADISVLALVGERGREVQEFIERDLGPEGLARSVVVVATSDEPALLRLRAALTATRIAEFFRDQSRNVLLLMDSLTRFCMAQREVGLSAGEPPATRGYPPSTFANLAKLLERAGNSSTGSITGLYTVLVDGDDMNEPVADAARGILDGHIVLSRRLAQAGHFPTIEVLDSVSRVSGSITDAQQRANATSLRRLLAAHRDARDLIDIGAYAPGSNRLVDTAVALEPQINALLRQDIHRVIPSTDSWSVLNGLVGGGVG
jgi:flagellum-specific ATP synthase